MNEPLTNSNKINFTGKTYNKHPQWYNQPLRLTKEQKRDPLPVLDDFFECYHLNEVRQTFWEWLTEVLSSQHSIAIEHLERNNHIYFYEKIEGVIEAVFVIRKKMHKHRRRWEKRKLKKGTLSEKDQVVSKKVNFNSATLTPAVETDDNVDIFNKPKQLIEYVDDDPLYVIDKIFKSDHLPNFCDKLSAWFDIAISAECSVYDEAEQRRQLILFRDQLLMLVEALHVIRTQNIKADIKEKIKEADKAKLLSQNQIANPLQIINSFFEKFPKIYITRELNDFLDAGICFSGPWPDNMCEVDVLDIYRNVLCLIKSAECILSPIQIFK